MKPAMKTDSQGRSIWISGWSVLVLVTVGCMAQQADLKKTEQSLQTRIKQSSDELAQRGAQQRQELAVLREQELPQLRGELDRAFKQASDLQAKQDNLNQRSAQIEQQTKKLEQLATKLESDTTTRYAWIQKSLDTQDLKNKEDRDRLRMEVNARLDDVNKQMELLRKDIIEAVQKTNSALVKNIDARLEEQHKATVENQNRTEQLAAKFSQFNQSLTAFRESLAGLNDRLAQDEHATKTLVNKLETDAKTSNAYVNDMNKTVTGHLGDVNKSVTSVAAVTQKLAARIDEQDRRLEILAKSVDQVAQDVHAHGGSKGGTRQPTSKPAHRSANIPTGEPQKSEPQGEQEQAEAPPQAVTEPVRSAQVIAAPVESDDEPKPQASREADRPDKAEYERLLGLFKDGNLVGAERGFHAFLANYPNSDLAPNARYWLGESQYGQKDYKEAISSYDRVELDYPRSEKVPAALLKKGYAYLALKDKKRASSAFKQVVTLYPKSPEAGKASDKLSQMTRESR
jgi:tol-pal system protein YbgF